MSQATDWECTFVCSGFEEILHPFKRKIPANFYPFKDKSLANTFLYHAKRGSQNSWTDKASHVRDFPIQASLALLQHQLPRGNAWTQLQVGSFVSQAGESYDTIKNSKRGCFPNEVKCSQKLLSQPSLGPSTRCSMHNGFPKISQTPPYPDKR